MILFHLFCLLINSFIHRRDLFSLHPSILAFRTASFFLSPTATPQANQCRMARRPSLLVIILLMYLFIHPSIFTRNSGWFSGSPRSLGSFPPNTGEVLTDVGQIGRAPEKPNCCNHIYLALICVFDILSQRPDNQSVGRAKPRAVKPRCLARAMLNTQHLGPP